MASANTSSRAAASPFRAFTSSSRKRSIRKKRAQGHKGAVYPFGYLSAKGQLTPLKLGDGHVYAVVEDNAGKQYAGYGGENLKGAGHDLWHMVGKQCKAQVSTTLGGNGSSKEG